MHSYLRDKRRHKCSQSAENVRQERCAENKNREARQQSRKKE